MSQENRPPSLLFLSLYDVLARILPGGVVIVGVLWARGSSLSAFAQSLGFEGTTPVYIVFLALSFLLGVLLTSIAGTLFEVCIQALARVFRQLKDVTAEKSWERIDAVGCSSAAAADVLAKISAEMSLCQNLLVGALVIAALSKRPIGLGSLTAIIVVLLFSWITRVVALQHRIRSFETLWVKPREGSQLPTDSASSSPSG